MAKVKIPKGLLVDSGVPGNTSLTGGINASGLRSTTIGGGRINLGSGSLGGYLQDSGVPAGPLGTYNGQTIYQPPGDLASGTVVGADQWGQQGWPAVNGPAYNTPGTDPTKPTKPPSGYYATLFDDPLYQAAMANYMTRTQTGRNNLRNQLRSAVIGSGYIPNYADNPDLAGYADDLDAETITRAQGNPTSQAALLTKQEDLARNDIPYRLAARGEGLIGGGTQEVASNNLQQQYTMARNQQMSSLLDALRGNIGGYASLLDTAGTDLTNTARDTALRLAQAGGPTWDLSSASPEAASAFGIAAPTTLANAAGEAGPVNWGGQSFTSRQGLTDFLRQFTRFGGITPEMFAATHPSAWGRLT